MKPASWVWDAMGLIGLICLSFGAWFEYGIGVALMIPGAALCLAAVVGAVRHQK